ncbi:Ribonuclease Y [Planctomycetes bacterium Pan216]|uniref:Ribonuclease Y n=1 Tax=Kolteria novifilia TaxID=2527975 RepID=A0A518AX50_9BACT|nr:Ribonuclease Y [Planctomycetes bacterium Pan216]
MELDIVSLLSAVATACVGAIFVLGLLIYNDRFRVSAATREADMIVEESRREAESTRKQSQLDARELALREREALLGELDEMRKELRAVERDVENRELEIERKLEAITKRERTLEAAQRKAADSVEQCEKRKQRLDVLLAEQRDVLQKITGMTKPQAEKLLLERLENDFSEEIGERVMRFEEQLRRDCEQKSKEILANAIQRYAPEYTAETTVATIDIPSDDMKGRIIGREGRNIRAFEKASGVDVIVDDTPGIVVVSTFDSVRREIGKLALQRLIADGRIHPTRIEEVVTEVKDDMENHILDLGKKAAQEAEVPNLHEKLIRLLGKLKFRTSYSQNVLNHSVEVALLCGLIADELGLDADLARRCGLLHDVGKAVDHEMEGGHPQIGADIARRCGENEIVLHAIGGHHDDVRVDMIYTVLVAAADAISASRPGARRETLEKYVKRLEELEAVATEQNGVEAAYAIQAGREIRVIVNSQKLSDKHAAKACRDIAQAIEKRLTYPGEIKVTVVRETRAVEYAR